MLPDDAKVVSVADHVVEHPRVWLDRLPRLEYVGVSACPAITDACLAVLRNLPELRHFEIQHQHTVTDAGIAHLADHRQLERVYLLGTQTGDAPLPFP